jgi:hypothetical protein
LLAEQGRRLRVRPSQPGLRGSRESLPGPTTWVRPATGWWGRMNAGRKTPRNQGRTVWAPLSASRRRSRDLRKTPQWSAERRAGPRHGSAIPSADGIGLSRKADQRPRRSAAANFGAPLPSVGGAKGSKPTIWTEARRDAPRGDAPPRLKRMHGENHDAEICTPNSPPSFRGAPKARTRNPETSGLPALLDSGFAASRRPGMTVEGLAERTRAPR